MPPQDPSQLDMFAGFDLETKTTNPAAADKRPLPLLIAEKWNFPLQHHGDMYSVNDWLNGVSQSNKGAMLLADIKRNPNGISDRLDSIQSMNYKRKNGKVYQMDFAPRLTLWAITQYMRAKSGIRDSVLKYLRDAGELMDELRTNPAAADNFKKSLDAQHGKLRKDSVDGRNGFTAAAVDTHYRRSPRIGQLTNENYKALFGLAKQELCIELGLDPDAKDLRDHFNNYALMAINAVETHAAELMSQLDRPLTDNEQINVGRSVANRFRHFFEEAALEVGQTLTAPRLTDGK